MGIFSIFRKKITAAEAEAEQIVAAAMEHAFADFELGILDRSANAIDAILDKARAERDRINANVLDSQAKIADWNEQGRHVDVVLNAFGAARASLEAGYDKAPAAPAPIDPPAAVADPAPVAVVDLAAASAA